MNGKITLKNAKVGDTVSWGGWSKNTGTVLATFGGHNDGANTNLLVLSDNSLHSIDGDGFYIECWIGPNQAIIDREVNNFNEFYHGL